MAGHTLPEYDSNMNAPSSIQMPASRISRRFSRSSGSQNGSQNWRSARIEKPRSNHHSPRAVDRRRTTTPSSKRYTTLDDHFNMMFGYSNQDDEPTSQPRSSVRPVSWHPSSSRNAEQHNFSPNEQYDWTHDQSNSLNGSTAPHQNRLSYFEDYTSNMTPAIDSYTNSPSWQDAAGERNSTHRLSEYSALNSQPAPWSVPDWVQMTQARSRDQTSMSPDMLPIQAPPETDAMQDDDDDEDCVQGKELVGMGLYDPPEGYNSWFAPGPREATGKGLKLEETWEPPSEKDEDSDSGSEDDEDQENNMETTQDDASSDEASVEEPPVPAPTTSTLPTKQMSTMHHGQQTFPVNMSGQSFFFEEDENLQGNWWQQQLRSSNAPSAAVGYGWI